MADKLFKGMPEHLQKLRKSAQCKQREKARKEWWAKNRRDDSGNSGK